MVSLLHCSLVLSFFICIIISLRPAWLARALLSFKRAQSSGNDDADEGQKTPFGAKGYMCQSSSPKLPKAVDTAVGWQLPVVLATSPDLRKLGELL